MEELQKLYARLAKTGKDEPVRLALEAVLISPDNLDFQINTLGAAHRASWLPNRKKILWQSFAIGNEQWASRCVERSTAPASDADAVCALLNAPVLVVLNSVRAYSPDLVLTWDVNGAPSCGLAFAQCHSGRFDHYFYVGWKPGQGTVLRLEYIPRIHPPPEQGGQRLDRIDGSCHVTGGCWAELPYGFGYWASRREFAGSPRDSAPHGYTASVQRELGYMSGAGAV